jgi:hypothetical protein
MKLLRRLWFGMSAVAVAFSWPYGAQALTGLQRAPSCTEVAEFLNRSAASRAVSGTREWGEENLECGVVGGKVAASPLELLKTNWNRSLRRWEFALRCAHPEDCVPFLVWSRGGPRLSEKDSVGREAKFGQGSFPAKTSVLKMREPNQPGPGGGEPMVKLGQTATLTWEQSGLRIVLPVTCLEAGGMGEFVRVRFKNTPRILRAEVVGKAALRAQL